MERRVLLDANILVYLFDESAMGNAAPSAKLQACLDQLLSDDETKLCITPLIRYEVLRGIALKDKEQHRQLKSRLDELIELDVGREAAELAAELFRLYTSEHRNDPGVNVDKRRFDAFHFAVAKLLKLELVSNDEGIISLEVLYDRLGGLRG